MANIEELRKIGIDVDMGIKRCANKENLYLRLISTIPSNEGFNNLYKALKDNNLDEAFNLAHGLKGIITNLSITPLEKPIIDITEHLRNKDNIDYISYIEIIEKERKNLEDALNK